MPGADITSAIHSAIERHVDLEILCSELFANECEYGYEMHITACILHVAARSMDPPAKTVRHRKLRLAKL